MKNVSQKAKNRLLFNKSFFGLIVGLLVVASIGYYVVHEQFKGEESSPPTLASETALLQGLIKTGQFLRFDQDDFERTALLPSPTNRTRGLSYYYSERDITMLEIAKSIKPDNNLQIIIAHYGNNLNKASGEGDRIFYTYPHGTYKNTKAINASNDSTYTIKAYDGFIIAGSIDYATWNIKHLSERPSVNINNLNTFNRGWHLIASNNLEETIASCMNRVSSIWVYNKTASRDFQKVELSTPQLASGKYMAWIYLKGDANSCTVLEAGSGSLEDDEGGSGSLGEGGSGSLGEGGSGSLGEGGRTRGCAYEDTQYRLSDTFTNSEGLECICISTGVSCFEEESECENTGDLSDDESKICIDSVWIECNDETGTLLFRRSSTLFSKSRFIDPILQNYVCENGKWEETTNLSNEEIQVVIEEIEQIQSGSGSGIVVSPSENRLDLDNFRNTLEESLVTNTENNSNNDNGGSGSGTAIEKIRNDIRSKSEIIKEISSEQIVTSKVLDELLKPAITQDEILSRESLVKSREITEKDLDLTLNEIVSVFQVTQESGLNIIDPIALENELKSLNYSANSTVLVNDFVDAIEKLSK